MNIAADIRQHAAVLLGCLMMVSFPTVASAAQIKQLKQAAQPVKITTNFIAEARLTASEVKQVLQLAKACGIDTPAEVRTFHFLPTGDRGISVESVRQVDGRNTSFETVIIYKLGWAQDQPDKKSMRVGNFWAEADAKHSTLLRSYEFKKATIQVSIGKGIDLAFADKVIPLIDAKKVRFENGSVLQAIERLGDSKPVSLYRSNFGASYQLQFNEPSMRAIMFDVKDGQVVVTGVATIHI